MRLARIIGFGFIGIIALVACAAGVLVWVLVPAENGTISLPGLSAPVAVSFDVDGIPTIKAGSDKDAAEALGYLHARDRLFEMDLMRRAAGGTLAQLFGPVALNNDEEMRRLGLRQSAAADEADLSPDARAMLQAYADGVNAWIAQRGRFAAPEFVVFGRPPLWTVTDSLLWGKTLGLWLSGNWRIEIERLALSATVPEQKNESMWPPDTGLVPEQAALTTPGLAAAAAGSLRWMRHFPEPFTQPQLASNEWAVSGAHTASGKPLLAGDPHLGFGFPSLWYLAKIETPNGTLAGATAPGTPFMVIGHNDHVAWTFTDTGAAVQDVFIEHPAADGKEYQTPDGPRPFITRTERIVVAGHADVLLSVRETRHGPVIGATPDGHALLAVEMANLQPDDTDADGLLLLNRASSVPDVEAAAQKITSPVQNLLAADTAGHIGFFTTGKVPIRKAGDGRWPVDGADGLHDWTGFASGDALPHIIDPPGGILLNANNPTVGLDFPVLIARDNYPDFRARRIRALLETPEEQTPASFGRIQLDVTSDFAQRLLPRLLALAVPANDKAAPVAALLRGWPGDMAVDKPQPLIFSAWTDIFVANLLRDNGIGEDDAPVVQDKFLLSLLGPGPGSAPAAEMWCGGDCNKQLLAALDEAAALLRAKYGADPAAWRWGDAHRAVFAHPLLGRLPVIGRFGRFTITVPGDATTIDVSGSWPATPADFDFTAVHGPELRAVFDLSDLNSSLFVIAPGESGNLLRRHAGDFLVRWRDGQYMTLGGSGYGSITLLPGG